MIAKLWSLCAARMRAALAQLSAKQRVALIIVLFATFAAVDIIYIARAFSGGGSSLKIEHLKLIPNGTDTKQRPEQAQG